MPSEFDAYVPRSGSDWFQLGVIWLVVYVLLRLVRGTIAASILRGAVLMGVLAIVLTAFVLRAFELQVLEVILAVVLNGLALALIVVFQPELRRGLLSLGEHDFFDRFRPKPRSCATDLARAIQNLARERHGALFAVERRNTLNHIVATGIRLDARASAEMLANVFWPGAPMHDGGVVIRGDRIVAAGCLFPLAERRDLSSRLGTRHRAGVGLSEESDAVIVIVSEETGTVSLAVGGVLETVERPSEIAARIDELLGAEQELPPPQTDVAGTAEAAA